VDQASVYRLRSRDVLTKDGLTGGRCLSGFHCPRCVTVSLRRP